MMRDPKPLVVTIKIVEHGMGWEHQMLDVNSGIGIVRAPICSLLESAAGGVERDVSVDRQRPPQLSFATLTDY